MSIVGERLKTALETLPKHEGLSWGRELVLDIATWVAAGNPEIPGHNMSASDLAEALSIPEQQYISGWSWTVSKAFLKKIGAVDEKGEFLRGLNDPEIDELRSKLECAA